jgi:cobaltochelatase CobN
MGVEPKWDSRGRVIYYTKPLDSNLHIMDESELTIRLTNGTEIARPRIDVIGHSSGLHRDQFPLQMGLLDGAVRIVSQLDEPEDRNYVRKHSLELKEYYMELMGSMNMTVDEAEAEKLSMARIFGPPEGDYGVRIADALSASDTWDNTDRIADQFIERSGNVYIGGEMYTSPLISGQDVFKAAIKDTDASLFIRSSNLYGVLTGDDPFQYFGGLSLAIARVSDGDRPEMWITNARDSGNPRMQTLDEFINLEMKTQMLNPNYIKGMMEHGYAGAGKLGDHLENLWGWDAVDSRFVDSNDWNAVYEVYIEDKYDLGTKEWFNENSPWARQTMIARMLEATRKLDADGNPYWEAPDEVITALSSEYQESVDQYGPCCCMICCGNPLLDEYIQGKVTVPGMSEPPAGKPSKGSGHTSGNVQLVKSSSDGMSDNQSTAMDSGYGTSAEQSPSDKSAADSDYVEGYEMQTESNSQTSATSSSSTSFSGASLIGTLMILLIIGVMYAGFRKNN